MHILSPFNTRLTSTGHFWSELVKPYRVWEVKQGVLQIKVLCSVVRHTQLKLKEKFRSEKKHITEITQKYQQHLSYLLGRGERCQQNKSSPGQSTSGMDTLRPFTSSWILERCPFLELSVLVKEFSALSSSYAPHHCLFTSTNTTQVSNSL